MTVNQALDSAEWVSMSSVLTTSEASFEMTSSHSPCALALINPADIQWESKAGPFPLILETLCSQAFPEAPGQQLFQLSFATHRN